GIRTIQWYGPESSDQPRFRQGAGTRAASPLVRVDSRFGPARFGGRGGNAGGDGTACLAQESASIRLFVSISHPANGPRADSRLKGAWHGSDAERLGVSRPTRA